MFARVRLAQINSPLGRHDGDIYNHYFAHVKAANPHEPVAPYFERVIKPLIEREDVGFDDADEIDLDEELKEIQEEREGGDEDDAGDDDKEDEADKTRKVKETLDEPPK